MGQIMQRLLEGVQGELQAEERDLCAHLNAHAHLLTLEAHLNCLEGPGLGLDNSPTPGRKGKGKEAATPDDSPEGSVASDSTVRSKRRLNPGKLWDALLCGVQAAVRRMIQKGQPFCETRL